MKNYPEQICFAGCLKDMEYYRNENYSVVREKAEVYSVKKLVPAEIIALFANIDVVVVNNMINKYGLPAIPKYLDAEDLTPSQKKKLKMLFSLCSEVNSSMCLEKGKLNSTSIAGDYFLQLLRHEEIEKFYVAFLGTNNCLINCEEMFSGTVDVSNVYIRDIIKRALDYNAVSIIVSHNHPSNSVNLSRFDIDLTERLKAALALVEIKLIDHIVVTGNTYISYADKFT